MVHDNISLCELWHRRFAHLHYRALPALRKMVIGLPELQVEHDGICRGCALGKNAKGSFPSSDSRSKGILDLVHSDGSGLMIVSSLVGFLYYMVFIDDFSHKTWIYFMKNMDEVFNRFKEFWAQVENLTWKQIKVLKSDIGGEYTSKDFSDFYKEAGIKRKLTVPYNHQQNGVAERKNWSIVEAAKAMIHDQDLTMFSWVEPSNTTIYVENRSPHRILGDKTPEEAFTGVKPEVSHLRIFGCPMYIRVPKEKRSKLEPSRKKGTFVGYNGTSKAYKI